ncbi:thioredoxin [Streptococcus suis]|uniref:Thioredoxin n=1 Tax=Streptococcus suis TaxID=1307 RepID=A0A426G2Y4_STRSU|nr:thioredoxin [Streptococcus suis]RRN49360.1 thioredoxin [Streptococcus suis]
MAYLLGERSQPIAAYPHIPGANSRIAAHYGVTFGQAYQSTLAEGKLVLNSFHPALALTYLKDRLPNHQHYAIVTAIQSAFYQDGLSLSDISTYGKIAEQFSLDRQQVETDLAHVFQQDSSPEFIQARQLGVQTYPTLLLEKNGMFYDVRRQAMTVAELEMNLDQLLKDN